MLKFLPPKMTIRFLDQDIFSFIKCLFTDKKVNQCVIFYGNVTFILIMTLLALANFIFLVIIKRVSDDNCATIFKVVLVEQFIELLNIIVYNLMVYYYPSYILVYQISLILFLILAFGQVFHIIYLIIKLKNGNTVNIGRSVAINRISSGVLCSLSVFIYFMMITVCWYTAFFSNVSTFLWFLIIFLLLIQTMLLGMRLKFMVGIWSRTLLYSANKRTNRLNEDPNEHFGSFLTSILVI